MPSQSLFVRRLFCLCVIYVLCSTRRRREKLTFSDEKTKHMPSESGGAALRVRVTADRSPSDLQEGRRRVRGCSEGRQRKGHVHAESDGPR